MTDTDITTEADIFVEFGPSLKSTLRPTEQLIIKAIVKTEWRNLQAANILSNLARNQPTVLTVGRVKELFSDLVKWFEPLFPGLEIELNVSSS